MAHLRAVVLRSIPAGSESDFPFSVPVIRNLGRFETDRPVTFLVGENGSGKSTLMEGIAAAARLPTVGAESVTADDTLTAQRRLASQLRLVWNDRASRGFFLRAEDFFGFTKALTRMRSELTNQLRVLEEEYRDRSAYSKGLAQGPMRASLADMERRYGIDLDASSHGQSFLRLFKSRFVPGGLYLLDEPEAPLSPQSQLGLIAMIADMLREDAQFIISTHSPILLAFPGAAIYSCDTGTLLPVDFGELEHVSLTRDFLNDPEKFLRHLTE